MRGRWAAGIVPRNFCWIIKDHFAVSERPGGYAPNHRKVRRQEELLWLRAQGFTRVVSLLGSTHNLHAYDELGLEWSRFPMPAGSETREVLAELYPAMHRWLRTGERLLLHQEELGDRVMGVAAGYLLWSEILPDGPRAITAMEQLLRRQMGTIGRMIVTVVDEVPSYESSISSAREAGVLDGEATVSAERGEATSEGEGAAPAPDGGEVATKGGEAAQEADASASDADDAAPSDSGGVENVEAAGTQEGVASAETIFAEKKATSEANEPGSGNGAAPRRAKDAEPAPAAKPPASKTSASRATAADAAAAQATGGDAPAEQVPPAAPA